MKKIFTFFAAMLLALTASATKMTITPTHWDEGDVADRSLFRAVTQSTVDTIVLSTGTYIESQSITIAADRNVVMMAADGATPVVKCSGFFDVYASVVAIGIQFQFVGDAGNGYGFYVHNSAHKYIKLEGCDMYGYTKPCIEESSSYHLDSVLINNCYFRNNTGSCLLLKETADLRIVVKNSTFANIDASAASAGVVEIRTASGNVKIDNCTFYNCPVTNYDYAAIKCASNSNVAISNCIVTLPEPDTRTNKIRAIHVQSKVIKNCLTFNYVQNDNSGMRDGTYENCLINQDPLYTDSANLDLHLLETSPAHEAGVAGTHLGDPRWWPASWQPAEIIPVNAVELNESELEIEVDDIAVLTATVTPDNATDPTVSWSSSNNAIAYVTGGVVSAVAEGGPVTITATAGEKSATCAVTVKAATKPETDFSSPLILAGRKAHIEGNIWKNADYHLFYNNKSTQGVASWQITVDQPCVVNAVVNGMVKTGQWFELDLYDSEDNRIDSVANPVARAWSNGGNPNIQLDSTGHSTLTFPAKGTYTLKLRNEMTWSSAEYSGLTLTKEYDLIDIYLKAGVWNADEAKFGVYDRGSSSWWPEFMVNVEGDLYVFRNFPANKIYLNFVRFNNTADAPSDTYKWNEVVDKTRTNDNNYFKISDWSAGDWRKYFPGFEAGYYLVGTHNSWEPKAADILAENVEGVEYMITKNAEEGDQFKAISIDTEGLNAGWYPDGDNNEYTIPAELAGNVTIYFKPAGDDSWPDTNGGDKKFYVVRNGDPTAIDNTVVGEKAVKLMENGQIVIIKNGVRYNVLGTVVR